MALRLRLYQEQQIDAVRQLMRRGVRTILVQSPTGSGKTIETAFMLATASMRGHRSWFIVHRRELIQQAVERFGDVGLRHGIVASEFPENPAESVQICSIQTLARRYFKLAAPKLIVWDECFPGTVKVGGIPIGLLRAGDVVPGRTGPRRVLRTMRSRPASLVRVCFGNGLSIPCTPGHPFLTDQGWVPAGLLAAGMVVLYIPNDAMHHVSASGAVQQSKVRARVQAEGSGLLLEEMLDAIPGAGVEPCDGGDQPQICVCPDEAQQSDEAQGCARKGKYKAAGYGVEAHQERGEWTRPYDSPASSGVRLGVEHGGSGADACQEGFGYRNELQARHSQYCPQGGDRSGRVFSLLTCKTGYGQKERADSLWLRVDRVEVLESTSDGTFAGMCPDGFVYNLEVDGDHTYLAEGVVVHNCHHVAAASWSKIFRAYPEAFHIGLTATPERLDGAGLGTWFDEMVLGPSVSDLIGQGFLSRYRLFAPSSINLSNVRTRMGDFLRSDLQSAVNRPTITGDVVSHYKKLVDGKRAVVFCVSVRHSQDVVAEFQNAGVPAEHVDGETATAVRDGVMRRFREGKTLVLSNCDLFGEGVDVPDLEAAILLRPTQSLGLYLQQCGRALRPAPGKEAAIILDHAGNAERHGLPDEDRPWTLGSRPRRARTDESAFPVRTCPACYAVQRPGPSACRECGHVFIVKAREIEVRDGDLVEVNPAVDQIRRRSEQSEARTHEDLVRLGRERGYRNPHRWAHHIMQWRQRKKLGM